MLHAPTIAQYYTVVIGMVSLILIATAFFIYFLRVGLDSRDAKRIDPKPEQPHIDLEKVEESLTPKA